MTGFEYKQLLRASQYDAHKALFDEYISYVYTLVWARIRSVGSHEDAEECVSDVFASLYLHLEGGNYTGDLKGIVSVISKRRAIDSYRRLNRKADLISDITDDELMKVKADIDIEKNTETEYDNGRLLDAVERLGEPDATIIIQKYFYNHTSKEIGKIVGLRSSAVRVRCSRALKKLKSILNESEG